MHRNPVANVDIWRIAPDGSGAVQLTQATGQDHTWPALSFDGGRVAYISGDAPGGLWSMRIDGTDQRYLTNEVDIDSRFAWSPDSSRLVVVNDFWKGNDVALVNADGTGYTQIGAASLGAQSVAWSPDGRTIAFSSSLGVPFGSQSIYRMNADGSNIAPVYVPQGDMEARYPSWSPDGSHLAFAVGPYFVMHLVVANADGSHLHAITSKPMCHDSAVAVNDINPSFSRDGRYIVFQREVMMSSSCASGTDIYLVHASGFGLTQLTHDGTSFGPSW